MELRQSTAVALAFGPFLDSVDANTPETTLTITQPDIRLKKNGAAWVQKNAAQTLTHEENGWYEIDLDVTDTATLGQLVIAVHESGALPVWQEHQVVTANYYDSKYGSAVREANLLQLSGDATAADNLEASYDGTGYGVLAQAGAASTITLDTGASAVNDYYNGLMIAIVGGPGSGQVRLITGYVGSTKVATISPNWVTNPTSASIFALLPFSANVVPPTAVAIANEVQTRTIAAVTALSAGERTAIAAAVAAPSAVAIGNEVQTRTIAAVTALSGAERNAIADAHLDRVDGIEVGVTPRQAMRLTIAPVAGKISGATAGSGTTTVRNAVADSKNRMVVTQDAFGNRTAITYDLST